MIGQWMGEYCGSVGGTIMVNIDEVEDHYEGVAYINPIDNDIPHSVAYFDTKDKGKEHNVTAYINAVDPRTGFQCEWEEIKNLYGDDVSHSKMAEVSLKMKGGKFIVNAVSDIGVILNSELVKPSDQLESKIDGKLLTWNEFKEYISGISKSKYLFRGQKKQWRLRTSFHRKGRYRISEFIKKDVRQLHNRLSAITSHYFDLSISEQNGSFFNLLQHHGYPTPLLDWSFSPYVSAFFAFRGLPPNFDGEGNVRVYIFDNEAWQKKYKQIQNLDPPFPHLSVMEFIAINNPRLVPQQAVTTVTNIDDIEAYLIDKGKNDKNEYLVAIDIPAKERETVIRDLRFMGITAGSVFPGIDGVCEELRELNFEQ